MPTVLESNDWCKGCESRRCRLHHLQERVLHKLYHDAEYEWRLLTDQRAFGFQGPPDWRQRALFPEAHRLLTIAVVGRTLHSRLFFPEQYSRGNIPDEGHQEAVLLLDQQRYYYELEAGVNGRAFLTPTSDTRVMEILFRTMEAQVTADSDNDGQYDYVLRLPDFETYEEVSPGTEGSIHRERRRVPPNEERNIVW